ncbi:hypothetical protein IWQ61_008477 [Dispira simplex]|nr:hypothetical protein IWQ61_008477 [Dispira simplex]
MIFTPRLLSGTQSLRQRALHTNRLVRSANATVSSKTVGNVTESIKPATTKIVYTRKGSVRSALFGLFFGATFASIFGATYLVEEVQRANSKLLATVHDLYEETEKIRGYLKRITELEKELQRLQTQSASQTHLSNLREDMRKLYDQVNREQLSLRAQLRDVEQDVHKTLKDQGKALEF